MLTPPSASKRPHPLTQHGRTRIDDYYWLRDRDDPETLAYLKAENAYLEATLAHASGLRETLFAEMKARIPESDVSAPQLIDDYSYYTRMEAGKEYPIYCRKQARPAASADAATARKKSCSTRTRWLWGSPTAAWARLSPAPTIPCWPTCWTTPGMRSTRCISRTCAAGCCSPRRSPTSTATWAAAPGWPGRATGRRCITPPWMTRTGLTGSTATCSAQIRLAMC